ncbi:MAG: alanine--tRNA ligase, partial [Planctomycetales bacterium]|nr:alanine--tRNA ligase [Planctomycetales bacterium]
LPTSKIERMEEDENFWPASAPSQGPDGVCGPCSEIYYHPQNGKAVEIWNLVFTQFNRVGDPPDNLRALPSKNIDTGMGLERTAATLQGVPTNYHIDNLFPLVLAAADVCGVKYELDSDNGRRLRRITDHVRACTFAIHENVYPGPNKEKYVIKRLLRRAVLDGHQMGLREPFLHQLVANVADAMGGPYPELKETVERVAGVIKTEEANFFGTIDGGLDRIERVFDQMRSENRALVDGAAAAELYQTFGVPPELFESLAAEHNLTFDWDGYRRAMEAHGEASGKAQHTVMGGTGPLDALKKAVKSTTFLGYETTEARATVKGIIAGQAPDDHLCDQMDEVGHADPIRVVLDQTPFYGESGGQVGDSGKLVGEGFEFEVSDTQKDGELIVHFGHLRSGVMHEGAHVEAQVDVERRDAIRRAHSATHILHYALQKNLGKHAQQQGSKVDADWLRFDFTNQASIEADQMTLIEHDISERVASDEPIQWKTLPLAEARQQGAMMLFGEKYPDPVRMVSMGEFSRELCGGTHLTATGQVGAFDIVSEEAVSAGTRRIVALTGKRALENEQRTRETLAQAASALGVAPLSVPGAVEQLAQAVRERKKALSGGGKVSPAAETKPTTGAAAAVADYAAVKQALAESGRLLNVAPFDILERIERLQAEVADLDQQLQARAAAGDVSVDSLIEAAEMVGNTRVIVADVPAANPNLMRQWIDQIRRKTGPAAILLATAAGDDKVVLVAGLSRELVDQGLSAGNWVRDVAKLVGGSGGGKPDLAQAGGKQPDQIPAALAEAKAIFSRLAAGS